MEETKGGPPSAKVMAKPIEFHDASAVTIEGLRQNSSIGNIAIEEDISRITVYQAEDLNEHDRLMVRFMYWAASRGRVDIVAPLIR